MRARALAWGRVWPVHMTLRWASPNPFFPSTPHVCWFPRPCFCSSKFNLFILSGPPCELFQETTVCWFFIDAHEAAAGQAGIFVLWWTAPGRKRGQRYRCQAGVPSIDAVVVGFVRSMLSVLRVSWDFLNCVFHGWRFAAVFAAFHGFEQREES
jgi:hypothetical protein